MIHITGPYYIDADTYGYSVVKKGKAETGKRAGEDTFTSIGYYPSYKLCFKAVVEACTQDGISGEMNGKVVLQAYNEVMDAINSMK